MDCDEHFRFLENDDHCILVEYLGKNIPTVTSVVIPETFNGKPVTAIGEKAFKNAAYPERVTLPDCVTDIGFEAFTDCSGLREIVWSNGLTHIGYGAFMWCASLERIELPEGVREIDMYAFKECASLKEVILPYSLETLERYSFENCSALEKVVFFNENKDTDIWEFAFKGCARLPVETLIYSLTGSCNAEAPFFYNDDFDFDWDTALREDVFAFAMERDSFKDVDKMSLFAKLFNKHLMERYFPYMKKNGWIYRGEQIKELAETLCYYLGGREILTSENADWFTELFPRLSDSLFDVLIEAEDTELTAWLLEYKNRRFGFDPEDKYEL